MSNVITNQGRESFQIRISGRYVGDVKDGVFHKVIKGSRHILRTPRAICLSVESLRQAEQLGALYIEVGDTETGFIYSCSIEHFKRFSFELQRGGFELQRALIIERWELTAPLEIESKAAKRGEVKRKAGNGQRVRNPRNVSQPAPRQLVFKGLL